MWKIDLEFTFPGKAVFDYGDSNSVVNSRRLIMNVSWRVLIGLLGMAVVLTVVSCSSSKDTLSPQDYPLNMLGGAGDVEFYPFDEPPVLVNYAKPEYPKGIEGNVDAEVLLKVEVDEYGDVDGVQVIRGSDERFEDEAVRTVKAFKFTPAKLNGEPTKCFVAIPIRFTKES